MRLDFEHIALPLAVVGLVTVLGACASRQPPAPPLPAPPAAKPQDRASGTSAETAPESTEVVSDPSEDDSSKGDGRGAEKSSPGDASGDDSVEGAPVAGEDTVDKAAGGAGDGEEMSGSQATPRSRSTPGRPSAGAKTAHEQTAELDQALDESLSEFDGMLLREQDRLAQRRSGDAGEVGGERGSEGASGTSEGGAGDDQRDGEGGGDAAEGEPASGGGGAGMSRPDELGGDDETAAKSAGRIPPDVGDGRDDDIVARQLREAAIKEDDPELREKLWQEYREYKTASQKNREDD